MNPTYSVLVPVYNHERYVGEALDSLLAQTCQDWEAVVVNDGSTDGTANVIDDYAAHESRIRIVHKANGGVSTALNAGLDVARGQWILWLSSDDKFEPHKLETHREWIGTHPGSELFFTQFRFLHDEIHELGEARDYREIPPADIQLIEMMRCIFVNGISICALRSAVVELGGFNEKMRYAQDFDLWLRMMFRGEAVHVPKCTCITRCHTQQLGAQFNSACFYESAASCLDALGNASLDKLFPLKGNGSLSLLAPALEVALSPRSVLYAMGQHDVLLRAICLWALALRKIDRERAVRFLSRRLMASARSQAGTRLGQHCADLLGELIAGTCRPIPVSAAQVAQATLSGQGEVAEGLSLAELHDYGEHRGWASGTVGSLPVASCMPQSRRVRLLIGCPQILPVILGLTVPLRLALRVVGAGKRI